MADLVAAPGRHTTIDPIVEAKLVAAGRFVRWVAFGFSLIMLLGYAIEPLRNVPPGPSLVRSTPIASSAPLAVLAFGALLAGESGHTLGSTAVWRRLGWALALASAAFGGLVLFTFFGNRLDMWGEVIEAPAFSVGVVLVVLGLAVPLSTSRREWRVISGQVGALMVFSLTAVIFIGYAYGDPSVGRLFLTPIISFQAAVTSVLVAVGVFLMRPARGLLSTASSPSAATSRSRDHAPAGRTVGRPASWRSVSSRRRCHSALAAARSPGGSASATRVPTWANPLLTSPL